MIRIKKAQKFIPYFLIMLIGVVVFFRTIGGGDEFWNYNFANNICLGMKPYADFSMVQTPLSAYIAAFFLTFLGKGLFSFRIVGYILFCLIFCLLYHLCKKISKSTMIALFATLFIESLQIIVFVYNYNYLNALIVLIIFEYEISSNDTLSKNIIIGLLVGLTPLIKQNTGAFIILANIIICFVMMFAYKHNKTYKLSRLIASFIPPICFFIFLFITETAPDFYEYAIQGISTFKHRYSLVNLATDKKISFVLLVLFTLLLIISIVKTIAKHKMNKYFAIYIYCIASLSILYPLCDTQHLFCAFITVLPCLLLNINKRMLKPYAYINTFVASFSTCLIILAMLPIGNDYKLCTINNYQGTFIEVNLENTINNVDRYIIEENKKGIDIRIVDDSSCAYMIPLGKYEKNWDMLLIGNIGNTDIDQLLSASKKRKYLVYKKTELLTMQNHFELIDYIKSNYKCIGEIECFDIYEKE